jgi:hypothetical protein
MERRIVVQWLCCRVSKQRYENLVSSRAIAVCVVGAFTYSLGHARRATQANVLKRDDAA